MKNLPIGISDYKEIIEKNCYYVDKTLLIEELLSMDNKVTLLCRPRRFGKTLNLSMLRYFFEKTEQSNEHLFINKKVWNNENARLQQGQYPVIFITFKDVKETTFDKAYESMLLLILKEFERHENSLLPTLNEHQVKKYAMIMTGEASSVLYGESLLFLSELLHEHYNKKVIVLLDEYDAPIHEAYSNGYYKEMVGFIKTLFSKVLKDNLNLERGVLTGILRTAKEGIFSDLNNLMVCTLLNKSYADKFGFTELEVQALLTDQKISVSLEDITHWYNGYHAGESTLIYNPWSILMCASADGELKPYWVNTSNNKLIATLLARSDNDTKIELEDILTNKPVVKIIDEAFTFADVEHDNNILWSLLLFSGYITYSERQLTEDGVYECLLTLPNHELSVLYKKLIRSIIKQIFNTDSKIKALFTAMSTSDEQTFGMLLQEFILNSVSCFDFPDKEPEKSYHLFILGVLVILNDVYTIKSNRESGYGRYDIMLIPHDKAQAGIIIEFKTALQQTLEQAVDIALKQIEDKHYAQELRALSINSIIAYGIAFQGREILVKSKSL